MNDHPNESQADFDTASARLKDPTRLALVGLVGTDRVWIQVITPTDPSSEKGMVLSAAARMLQTAFPGDKGIEYMDIQGCKGFTMSRAQYDMLRSQLNAGQQQGHAGRIVEERKDKGPPQVGG